MSDQVDVKIDLDLDDSKAKQKLEEFKNNAKNQDIKIKLDLSDIKNNTNKVKDTFNDAFKVKNFRDIDNLERKLKEINKVIKEQQKLSSGSNNKKSTFGIKIDTKTDIVKDTKILSDNFKKAKDQLKELDSYGKEMKTILDNFSKSQENNFKKFKADSEKYDKYLADISKDATSAELQKAIRAKKKQMDLQRELANIGVVKVNNDKIRNEKYDGSLHVAKNEKWQAMFTRDAKESAELENMARKIQPQITRNRKIVEETFKKLNEEEKQMFEKITNAYKERPKFEKINMEDSNMEYLKLMLQSSMSEIDKFGLDFHKTDDVFKGIDRYFTRLHQLQNEFNTKFSNQSEFKPITLDVLKNLEGSDTKENINKIDTNNDLLERALKERESILKHLYNSKNESRPTNIDKGLDASIKEYLSVVKKIESLNAELHKAESKNEHDVANALKEEMQLYQRKQLEITQNIRANNLLSESVKKIISQEEKLAQARTKTKNTKVNSNAFKEQQSELGRLNGELNKYYEKLNNIEHKLGQMKSSKGFMDKTLLQETNSLLDRTRESLNAKGIESDFNEISGCVKKLNTNLKDLSSGNTLNKQEASFNAAYSNMQQRLEKFIHTIQGMHGSDEVIQRLCHSFNSIKPDNIERASHQLREFGNQLNHAGNEMKHLNSGGGLFGKFGKDFKQNLFAFTAGQLVADGIRRAAYALKEAVLDLDNAYTELNKVLDKPLNAEGFKTMSREATRIAKDTAQSSADVIRTTADITQFAGISDVNKARKVAEQTMKLVNVTGMSQKDASKGVATLISAFKDEIVIGEKVTIGHGKNKKSVDSLTDAFDKLNFVGNKYAISSDGVVDALQAGGAVLSTTGVDLTHTIAMITAANKTLQDPRRVGNGLKTINNKLKGMKTNAKDGTLEMNKTAKSLREVAGIDIWDDKKSGKIKDTNKILEEVATKWGKLTDAQKAGLSEAIAGQHQSSVFQSLMKNFDEYKAIIDQFGNGEQFKSMEKENDQFVNSMAGQLNRLKETWLGIWNELGANQLFAGALKGLNSISDAIAKLVNKLSDLGVLQPLVGVIAGLLAFKQVKGAINTAKGLKRISDAIKGLGRSSREVENAGDIVSSVINTMGSNSRNASDELEKTGNILSRTKGKIKDFGTKVSKFMNTPLGIFTGYAVAASVGVYAIAKAYDYFNETSAEQSKRTGNLVKKRTEEVNQYGDQIKGLQKIQEEYDKLSSKQDKSSEDLKRIKELNNEIAKIRPDLVVGKDADGNAIIAMTGNVKELIEQLKEAQKEKKHLLGDAAKDDSESQVRARQNKKEVGGLEGGSQRMGVTNNLNDLQKLQEVQILHNTKMSNLEKQRNDAMEKAYSSSGKKRRKYIDEYNKANIEMLKEQTKFSTDYNKQLKVVKETSSKLGTSIFTELESKGNFSTLPEKIQKQFSGLKKELDFSDIQSPEQLTRAKNALSQLMEAGRNHKIDLGSLKKSLADANAEVKKTGDWKAYRKTISDLVNYVSKNGKIEDKNMLTDLFEGLGEGVEKGKSEMEKFLNAYNKSAADLANNDSFAIALATQKEHIESGIESIQTALESGDLEYKKRILVNITNDKDVPTQVRDMIKKLMDSGADTDKTLELAQDVLIDMKDGKIDNIDQFNKRISELTKGKVKFKLNPDMTLSEKSKEAGVETVIKQLNDRFDEVPATVTTIIKTEGITAYNDAKKILEQYNSIPPEIQTLIKNNGLESSQSIGVVSELLKTLPPEVVSNIVGNFPDAVKNSKDYQGVLSQLPPEVVTDIIVNSDPTTIETIKQAVKDMPEQKQVIIDVLAGAASGNIEQVNNALSNLPPQKRMEILAEIQNALSGMDTVESRQLSEKIAKLMADPSLALQGIGQVNGTPMTPKNTKVTESGSGVVQTMLNRINNTPNKHHRTQSSETGSSHVKRLLDLIMGVPNKKHTTTVINNGGQSVLDNLLSIIKLPETKKITVIASLIGNGISAAKKYFTGSGEIIKGGKITRTITQRLNVENSPSPVPMTTGAESTISSPTPMPTAAPIEGKVVPSGGDVVPSGYTTSAPLNSNGIDIGKIIPSFNYDINMLSSMENQLKAIGKQLDMISVKSKDAFGNEKIGYLNTQIELLRRQQSIQHELAESMRKQQNEIKYQMLGYGFTFDGDKVVNDIDLLMKANRTVDDLDRRVKADTENKDKALRDQYDAARTSLDKSKKLLSEYISLTFDKIPACSQEWWNLNEKIKGSTVEILKAKNELESMKVQIDSDKFDDNIKKIGSDISLLDKQIANGYSKDVQSLINKKIALLRKEQDEMHNLAESYRHQAKLQREVLSNQGFIFDNNGQLTNRELINSYIGTGLFDELNKQINEYNNLVHDKIPKLSVDWWNLYETISKTNESTIELVKNTEALPFNNSLEEISHAMDRVHDKLDLLEKKFKYVYGSDKVGYFNKRIELLEEEKKLVSDQYKEYLNVYNVLRKQVEPFGVNIDDSSLITNYDEVLNSYIGSNQYDKVKKALDEYIKLTRNDIPDAWKKLLDLDNNIKEAQKNKLDVIKNVEDEITKVYTKQVEERKKLIEDESKAKIKAINEEKDAYNKSRKEVKYNEELKDQKDVVKKLNEDIENAKRDTSISGQKHLKELLDKLKDENKKLQELVENKTDEVVNEMFDKEADRLQEEADKKKEALDQKFSPENIQSLVNEALNTGLFTDIDGNVKSLEDTLLDFVSKTSEGMGALGGVIKSELVTNLELAKDSYQELADIYKSLDMEKFYKAPINSQTPINNSGNNTTNNKVDVNFNQPFMVIHKVTKDAVPELEILLKKSEKRLAEEIVKKM